ncbi:MAG: hypothetical protein GWP47_04735 [Actinobacteria bacterium]|nr:hypothetical protein [Actinomycetota bacterium]NCG36668.1 hypothetical protein [Actinomycetota bacterium]
MKNDRNEIEPVSSELVLPPDASLSLVAERLVDQARTDGVSLTGDGVWGPNIASWLVRPRFGIRG